MSSLGMDRFLITHAVGTEFPHTKGFFMFIQRPLVRCLLLAFGGGISASAALISPARAQSNPPADVKLDRVEVTGSAIKRIDAETALPVQILRREDIERTGASSTEELVRSITALSSAGSTVSATSAAGYTTGGISTVSLRGLGSGRTLVLVNGRRLTVYGGGSAGSAGSSVDISSIPLNAIERVEVLKDGASAVYGSDAIAGVVNFILRKDFTGLDGTLSYGQPTRSGGADTKRASLFGGFGTLDTTGFNVNAGISVESTTPLFARSRDYARRINVDERNEVLSTISFPANVFAYGSGALRNPFLGTGALANPNGGGDPCGPVSQVSPFRPTACRFDNSPFVSLVAKSEKANVLLNGTLKVSDGFEAFAETGFNQTRTTTTTQPVPVSSFGNALTAANPYNAAFRTLVATQYPTLNAANSGSYSRTFGATYPGVFLLPTTSIYYPTAWANANGYSGLPLGLNYRDVANGERNTRDQADNLRLVTGVRGNAAQWDIESAVVYNESKVTSTLLTGYAQYSRVLPILNSGVINPFGPTTDPAALAAIRAAEFTGTAFNTKTSTLGVNVKGSRDIYALPAGNVALAMGAELRQEKFTYTPSLAIQQGDVAGLGGSSFPVSAKRNVTSAYAELNVPVVKNLDFDAAVRYDNYGNVGSTVNPKASLRWKATDWLLMRSQVGKGFRAPSLTDLYTPQATSVTANGTRDPLRCPNLTTGSPTDCSFQFTTITGGNPNLKPEKSTSYTLGIVLEPVRDLSVAVDYFNIELRDAIVPGGLNYTYFLANAARAQQYAAFINRGAPDGNASGVGPIIGIQQTNANLFKTKVSGLDLDAKYSWRLSSSARLRSGVSGTYFLKYASQGPDGTFGNAIDQALTASGGGVIVRWKHTAFVSYESGPYGVSVTQNYQKSYTDTAANFAPAGTSLRKVSSYNTVDLQGTYSGIKSLKFVLGVKNVEDKAPPYTNNTSNFLGGYDVTYGDPRGRFVYGSVNYSFK